MNGITSARYTEAAVQFPTSDRSRSWLKLKECDWKIRLTKVDAGDFKHEFLNRLRLTMAVNMLNITLLLWIVIYNSIWVHWIQCIVSGSRFRTYYDFGYVALDIIHATALDSGEYTVRATNHLGSAHSSACVRVRAHYLSVFMAVRCSYYFYF